MMSVLLIVGRCISYVISVLACQRACEGRILSPLKNQSIPYGASDVPVAKHSSCIVPDSYTFSDPVIFIPAERTIVVYCFICKSGTIMRIIKSNLFPVPVRYR